MTLPPPWDPEHDDTLVCTAVREETGDVRSFLLAPPEPRLFDFQPGQFMTFELPLDGGPVSRCYTIASSPARPHRVAITVKRTGPVSAWLHDRLRPGMRLRVAGPAGEFTCAAHPAPKYLFLSAGSGITPLMSMARWLDDLGSDADALFVHSARSPADLIFRDELALLARRPGFRSVAICGRDAPGGACWGGFRGRLSPAMLALIAPDLLEREAFCCGPAPYMAAVRDMLGAAGFAMARYHEESFAFAAGQPVDEEEPAAPAEGAYTVQLTRSGRDIACPPGTTVLAAARAAGLRLPSACTKGVCGTCKSRLISGTVDMRHGGGIRQREVDAGLILLCCSKPTSDLVVER